MDIKYYKKFEPIDGKYYINKELGSGAFGTVFEVQREDFPDMKSALKVISIPSSQSEVDNYREENFDLDDKSVTSYFYGFVEEFVKEFRLMSQLKGQSNIVSYEDHDVIKKEDGIGWDIFIRMELLTPMNKYFAINMPKESDVIKLGIDICKALEVCQKYKIIHRDIKPSNIFVSDTGDFKLGDFGVARTLEKTSSGLSKKGTYTYMAPEVYKGQPYGSNVDIYSLGIVMYKLLNNNLEPFRKDRTYNDGERALEMRLLGNRIPKPANADGRLAEIVLKACAFDPKERYESPLQMRQELESIQYNERERKVIFPDGDEVDYESTEGRKTQAKSINEEKDDFEDTTEGIFDNRAKSEKQRANENKRNEKKSHYTQLSDFEIEKFIQKSIVGDVNSDRVRFAMYDAIRKVLPYFDGNGKLSSHLTMNTPDEIKVRIVKLNTESVLKFCRALELYLQLGDDVNILGPVKNFSVSVLKSREITEFNNLRFENVIEQKETETKKGFAFFIQSYVNFWRQYADFKGCTSRKEYWTFVGANACVILILFSIAGFLHVAWKPLYSLYSFATFVPGLAICTRRLHDTGRSGHWQWLYLTVYGSIAVFVFLLFKSKHYDNKYRKQKQTFYLAR